MTAPVRRLVSVVVEVDQEHLDENAPTGLTPDGHIELRDAIAQVGTVAHISRATAPVPAPPAVPITNEKTRAYSRRRIALEHAVTLVAAAPRAALNEFSPEEKALAVARTFEEYLSGKADD